MKSFNLLQILALKKNIILNFIIEVLLITLSLTLFEKIFKTRFSKKHKTTFLLANSIVLAISNLFVNYFYSYVFMFAISIVMFIWILKVSKLQTFTYFSLQAIILFNVNFVTYQIIYPLSHYTYSQIINSPIYNIASLILVAAVGTILYFCFRNIKPDNFALTSISRKSSLIISIAILNLLIVNLIFPYFFEILTKNPLYVLTLDMYFFISITSIIYICSAIYSKQKIKNLNLCNKTILTMYDDTRAFKHDFHNILQAIGGYILTKDMEGLKKYYTEITGDCINSNNFCKLNPELINNPAIYNILVDKYTIANNNDIQINLDVMLDLNKLNIKIYELTRILGILLDNAIEASKECNEKNINISFKQDKQKQMLIVENTYNNKQVSIDKIFEKDFTTKPHNTGLGLWEVRKILNKNSNLNLHTSKNNDYFSQQLEIYTA